MEPLEDGLSIVIPVFNSAGILPALVARIEPVLSATQRPHELILVNDGSSDASWDVVRDLVYIDTRGSGESA